MSNKEDKEKLQELIKEDKKDKEELIKEDKKDKEELIKEVQRKTSRVDQTSQTSHRKPTL